MECGNEESSISTYDRHNTILKNVTLDLYVGVSQAKINKYSIRNEKEKLLILSSKLENIVLWRNGGSRHSGMSKTY